MKPELEALEALGFNEQHVYAMSEIRKNIWHQLNPPKEKEPVNEYADLTVGEKLQGLKSPDELPEGVKYSSQIVSTRAGDLQYAESFRDGTTWWETADNKVNVQIGGNEKILQILIEK